MSFLWEGVKDLASKAGDAAGKASTRARLNAELLYHDHEIKARQQTFGLQLFDYVTPLSQNPDFFAASDTLTETVRPCLIKAQREISSLEIKRRQLKQQMADFEASRQASFTPAENWQDKLKNTAKATYFVGDAAGLHTELKVIETQIATQKQNFGCDVYPQFESLENEKNWLPTDRDIRSMYDKCRQDIEAIRKKKEAKTKEIVALGGTGSCGDADGDGDGSGEGNATYGVDGAGGFRDGPPQTATGTMTQQQQQTFVNSNPYNANNIQTMAKDLPQNNLPRQQPQSAYAASTAGASLSSYGATTTGTAMMPQQQQQQQPNNAAPFAPAQPTTAAAAQDPFAGFLAASAASSQSGQQQSSGMMNGTMNHNNNNNMFMTPQSQQSQQPHDPFAQAPPPQQQQLQDPFAPVPTTTAAAPSAFNNNDPFAGLSAGAPMSQQPPQQQQPFGGTAQQQQPPPTTNNDPFAALPPAPAPSSANNTANNNAPTTGLFAGIPGARDAGNDLMTTMATSQVKKSFNGMFGQ